jgi:hypothetical protein
MLDHFDTVARYAQRPVHELTDDGLATRDTLADESQHPPGIETDHDARILDEIEASLRALITADHGDDEDMRLTDISRIAAEALAERQPVNEPAADEIASEPQAAGQYAPQQRPEIPEAHNLVADMATVRAAFRDPRTPPWLLARSLDPEPIPEPVDEHWPQPRKRRRARSKANSLFLRFGLAATGAAVVAAVAVKDIPALVLDYVRGPIEHLSTNAASVFNEGKATSLQARMDGVQKEQDRASEPALRFAVATAADPQALAIPVKTETIGRVSEPRKEVKETVMPPWPSPDVANRNEPAHWQPPSVQIPASMRAPLPAPAKDLANARPLNGEEVAMLRKMGDDYIAAGDFVGARAVLERAADAGDASAAFAIASTYDPVVLARFKVRGLEPDIVKASFWYERARELGSPEAPHRLQAMIASRAN